MPESESVSAGRGRISVQVIYLHGQEPLATAIGPRDFRATRQAGETEKAFRDRALDEASKLHLPWLAFQKPALPPRAMPAFDDAEAL